MPIIYIDRRADQALETPPENRAASSCLAEIDAKVDTSQENLNDTEFDVTWGGKRTRYLYNCEVQTTDCSESDSNCTESVLSVQSKSTMTIHSEVDEFVCDCNCDCRNNPEFEVVSSNSSFNVDNSTDHSSDSAVPCNYKFSKKAIDRDIFKHSSDTGYHQENTDGTDNQKIDSKKQPPPACFKKCAQCQKLNSNPYFQYCLSCFELRKEFFVCKPKSRDKRSKVSNSTNSRDLYTDTETPSSSNPHQSSSLCTDEEQNTIDKSKVKSVDSTTIDMYEQFCKICFVKPLDGIFNHGKISHIYSCYMCSKKLFKKTNKCPICDVKVKYVTKMIVV